MERPASPPQYPDGNRTSLSELRQDRDAAMAFVRHAAATDGPLGSLLAVSLGVEGDVETLDGTTALSCTAALVSDATNVARLLVELRSAAAGTLFGLRAEGCPDAPLSTLQLACARMSYVIDVATLRLNADGRLASADLMHFLLEQRVVRHGVHACEIVRSFPEVFGDDESHQRLTELSTRWVEASSLLLAAYPEWPLGRLGAQLGPLAAFALWEDGKPRKLGRRAQSVDASKLKRPLRPAEIDALALRARVLVSVAATLTRRGAPAPETCPLQLACQCTAASAGGKRRAVGRSIVDVGAQHGVCGRALQKRAAADSEGWLPVVYIEPDEVSRGRIDCSASDVLLGVACAPQDGWAVLHLYQPGTHSLLPVVETNLAKYTDGYTGRTASAEEWRRRAAVPVRCFRLERICDELGICEIAVLKIDTQGFDLEVLRSLGDRLLSRTDRVQCEVQLMDFELYRGASKREELLQHMQERDFNLVDERKQCYGQESNLTFERMRSVGGDSPRRAETHPHVIDSFSVHPPVPLHPPGGGD